MNEADIERIRRAIVERVTRAGTDGLDAWQLVTALVHDHVANNEFDVQKVLIAMGIASADIGIQFTTSGRLRLLRPNESAPLPYDR